MLQLHKFAKCFIKPLNVRYSGNLFKQGAGMDSIIQQTLNKNRKPTTNEWHELRESLLLQSKKSSVNVDGTIVENCLPNQLNIGKSYIDYLKKSDQELKVDTLANFLKLYYSASKHGTEITAKDQQEIMDMCKYLVEKCPIFGAKLGAAIIQGLVLTADWRKSLDILDSIKIYAEPQMIAYSAIVQRAIQEDDDHLAWNLLNVMARDCDALDDDVFVTWIDHYCKKKDGSLPENINKILTFIGDNQIVISRKVANEFRQVFRKLNGRCHYTTVSNKGECNSCRKRLRSISITDDEFNSLSSHFSDNALILSKSTPQELESFKSFIDRTMPYDCVIDGLNTSMLQPNQQHHSHTSTVQIFLLVSVVKHFVKQKKTVLVIGRKHLEHFPQMNYIRKNAHLFLTENVSKDDPFFLYSALRSGPNTDFVTRDLLRDHALKMTDKLRSTFRRWQQQHQYLVKSVSDSGSVLFENRTKNRIDFDRSAQQVDDGCWHIPFEDSANCTFQYCESRKNWLCVPKN